MTDPKIITKRVALVIPAFEPDQKLMNLIKRICPLWAGPVVVVDDGSGRQAQEILVQARQAGVVVLRHGVNRGKGRALKTAFHYCLSLSAPLIGCVTADADGQHTAQDILRCAAALNCVPDHLVLGCRDFSAPQVPWKSRCGNLYTRFFMKWFCGVQLSDTQTGLRAIPADFMRQLLTTYGERYEFETNMLLDARRIGVPVQEIPIETVYLNDNRSSHFRPLRDGLSICALFLRFLAVSLGSAALDILCFSLFVPLLQPLLPGAYILLSTVLARILSSLANYTANSHTVFHKKANRQRLCRYGLLCVMQMLVSAGMVALVFRLADWPEFLCKLFVDSLLFLVSFQIQNRWIFR